MANKFDKAEAKRVETKAPEVNNLALGYVVKEESYTARCNIALQPSVKAELDKLVKEDGRSLNKYVSDLIKQHIAKFK